MTSNFIVFVFKCKKQTASRKRKPYIKNVNFLAFLLYVSIGSMFGNNRDLLSATFWVIRNLTQRNRLIRKMSLEYF
ncbi:MAG: hypothetical protein D6707_12675 [Bacteroidetes bacterium]|nr:MAG: hypothetical protein D6707_12675 [Bacteroidota bacterium]